jgi:hypothetical protein
MATAQEKQAQQAQAKVDYLNTSFATDMKPYQDLLASLGDGPRGGDGGDGGFSFDPTPEPDGGGGGDGTFTPAPAANREQKEARAELEAWLSTFFDPARDADTIKALMGFVDSELINDTPSAAIMLNIRKQPFYIERFKGNIGLRSANLPELNPAEYLAYEKTAAEYLASAGLGDIATRGNFAALIGGAVSTAELQDRVVKVYGRIKNADQALKDEMQRLGELGNLTASDFAAAMLTGKEGAASLQRKIATAEVSTEFTQRGLQSALGAQDLAAAGVTRQQAMAGAEYTRQGTQRLTDLASIYGDNRNGIQGELESEAFKGLASERRKKLAQQESAAFSGSSGIGTPSLATGGAGRL